jgi:hypothetical protein
MTRRCARFLVAGLTATAATALAAPGLASDLLVLRDGSRQAGRLMGCAGANCAFDRGVVPRERIEWIGFGVAEDVAPPAPSQTREDEIHLVAGGTRVAAVRGITLAAVSTAEGPIDRESARWVRLAAGAAEEQAATPPAPRPAPPRRTPRSAGDRVSACPADQPLGGFVELDQTYHTYSDRCHGQAKLWFELVAAPQLPWPAVLGQAYHARTIVYELSSRGCFGVPNPAGRSCSAPRRRVSGRVDFGVGQFGVENFPSSISFHPTGPEIGFSTLPDEISRGLVLPLTCVDTGGSSTGDWTYSVGGAVMPFSRGGCSEPGRNFACTAATLCEGEARADCTLHPDRYAVIPFRGEESWSLSWPDQRAEDHAYYWEVCCGCGEPGRDSRRGAAPTSTPESDEQACPEPRNEQALLEAARAQRMDLIRQLYAVDDQRDLLERRRDALSGGDPRRDPLNEQIQALDARMAALRAEIAAKENEIANLQEVYRRACEEYQGCRGGDAAACNP